jgi:hypothetical protein
MTHPSAGIYVLGSYIALKRLLRRVKTTSSAAKMAPLSQSAVRKVALEAVATSSREVDLLDGEHDGGDRNEGGRTWWVKTRRVNLVLLLANVVTSRDLTLCMTCAESSTRSSPGRPPPRSQCPTPPESQVSHLHRRWQNPIQFRLPFASLL